ncbi:MAG: hypothetical protein WBB86_03605, partial [Candidatus Omnitrophota bacterium]
EGHKVAVYIDGEKVTSDEDDGAEIELYYWSDLGEGRLEKMQSVMSPGRKPARIGKKLEATRVEARPEEETLSVTAKDAKTGEIKTFDLKILPQTIDSVEPLTDKSGHKWHIMKKILGLAGGIKHMFVYEERPKDRGKIKDMFGFASASTEEDPEAPDFIALHKDIAEEKVAAFHEACEYLVKKGEIKIEFKGWFTRLFSKLKLLWLFKWLGLVSGRIILTDRRGEEIDTWNYVRGEGDEVLAIALKGIDDPHYLLRAWQRHLLGDQDKEFMARLKIKHNLRSGTMHDLLKKTSKTRDKEFAKYFSSALGGEEDYVPEERDFEYLAKIDLKTGESAISEIRRNLSEAMVADPSLINKVVEIIKNSKDNRIKSYFAWVIVGATDDHFARRIILDIRDRKREALEAELENLPEGSNIPADYFEREYELRREEEEEPKIPTLTFEQCRVIIDVMRGMEEGYDPDDRFRGRLGCLGVLRRAITNDPDLLGGFINLLESERDASIRANIAEILASPDLYTYAHRKPTPRQFDILIKAMRKAGDAVDSSGYFFVRRHFSNVLINFLIKSPEFKDGLLELIRTEKDTNMKGYFARTLARGTEERRDIAFDNEQIDMLFSEAIKMPQDTHPFAALNLYEAYIAAISVSKNAGTPPERFEGLLTL